LSALTRRPSSRTSSIDSKTPEFDREVERVDSPSKLKDIFDRQQEGSGMLHGPGFAGLDGGEEIDEVTEALDDSASKSRTGSRNDTTESGWEVLASPDGATTWEIVSPVIGQAD
jgi:hypothetical protein